MTADTVTDVTTDGYEAAGELLRALAAPLRIGIVTELAAGPRTALMCLEAAPAVCHRRVLVEALRRRRLGLEVVDL